MWRSGWILTRARSPWPCSTSSAGVDCIPDSDSEWAEPGAWHWVLSRPTEFKTPIACLGRLKLFAPDVSRRRLAAASQHAVRRRKRGK